MQPGLVARCCAPEASCGAVGLKALLDPRISSEEQGQSRGEREDGEERKGKLKPQNFWRPKLFQVAFGGSHPRKEIDLTLKLKNIFAAFM